jgi:hypothetical protein
VTSDKPLKVRGEGGAEASFELLVDMGAGVLVDVPVAVRSLAMAKRGYAGSSRNPRTVGKPSTLNACHHPCYHPNAPGGFA